MSTVNLANGQVAEIINGPYYHSNIDNFEKFGGKKDRYISDLKEVLESGRLDLEAIIIEQEEQELEQLNLIFNKDITKTALEVMGFNSSQADSFLKSYEGGRRASSVEDKLHYLNLLTQNSLDSKVEDNVADGLNYAIQQIALAFGDGELGSVNIPIGKYQIFLDALLSVYDALISSQKRLEAKLPKDIILRPINKLRKAISFYEQQYSKLVVQEEEHIKKMDKFKKSLSNSEIIDAVWNSNKAANRRNLSTIKTVLIDSATGFVNQLKGKDFEEGLAKLLAQRVGLIFDGQKILLGKPQGSVVGKNVDKLNKFQKADIKIEMELSGSLPNNNKFSLTFSVKLAKGSSTIQFHHGGGLFSYANRFSSYNAKIGALLNDGNFQYNYVNSLQSRSKDDFLNAVKTMLQGVGFYFLGEKIKNQSGADFLYVTNKIISFSSVLKEISKNPKLLNVRVRATKFNALSEKKNQIRKNFSKRVPEEYYQKDFIEMSMGIGRKAINGTTFTLDLRKSALNL